MKKTRNLVTVGATSICVIFLLIGVITFAQPAAPIATAGTGATTTQFTANWNAVAGVTRYLLDVSTVSTFVSFVNGCGGSPCNAYAVSGGTTSFNVTSLRCNTIYFYRLRAVETGCGTSGNSNTIFYSTTGCGPCAITFRSSASVAPGFTTSTLLPKPAGTVEDDVLIAQIVLRDGSNQIVTPPTGWTMVREDAGGPSTRHVSRIYYKVAGAAEPADYNFTHANSYNMGGIAAFVGVNTVSPINAHGGLVVDGNLTTSDVVVAPSITTTDDSTMLVGMFSTYVTSSTAPLAFTPPGGMTEQWDAAAVGTNAVAGEGATEGLLTVAGATGTRTASFTTAGGAINKVIGQLIALDCP